MFKRTSLLFFLIIFSALVAVFIWYIRLTPAGTWYGFSAGGGGKIRVALVIVKLIDGTYSVIATGVDANYEHTFINVTAKKASIHGDDDSGTSFDLKMDLSGRSLSGQWKIQSNTYNLNLKRGKNFIVPRVNFNDRATLEYSYKIPRKMSDGLETADIQSNGGNLQKNVEGIQQILESNYPNIHSLVVLRHGKLVLEEYFYGYGPQDEHPLQSATKSVLSVLFGIAQDQGLVNAKDKLYDYYPEYRNKPGWSKKKNNITLGNLLSMTSGFACDDFFPQTDCHFEMFKTNDWLNFILSQPMNNKPGDHWAYCNDCMELLGAVIARKSGMSIPNFAEKYLYEPMGIKAHYWFTGPHQVTEVCGSHWLKPRDMVKLGYLYLKKGDWEGKRIVSENWVMESTKPQANTPRDKPRTFDYGYLWWLEKMPYKGRKISVFYANGLGNQYIFVVPDLDLVCVITAGNFKNSNVDHNPGLDLFKDHLLGSFD